jgi:hypothetical protein
VSCASAKDKEAEPALRRTLCVEQFEQGLRLIATDSYRLLVTWVNAEEYDWDDEPGYDELPHATAVAIDEHGRARSLCAYLMQQAQKEENDGLSALVRLGVPWQAAETPSGELQLDGFDALAIDLEYPDHERLQLPVFEGKYPTWRTVLKSFKPQKTPALALSQESYAAIAKAASYFGELTQIETRFGGTDKALAVAFGSEPRVHGLVMPMKWDFEKDAPAEPVEP